MSKSAFLMGVDHRECKFLGGSGRRHCWFKTCRRLVGLLFHVLPKYLQYVLSFSHS